MEKETETLLPIVSQFKLIVRINLAAVSLFRTHNSTWPAAATSPSPSPSSLCPIKLLDGESLETLAEEMKLVP